VSSWLSSAPLISVLPGQPYGRAGVPAGPILLLDETSWQVWLESVTPGGRDSHRIVIQNGLIIVVLDAGRKSTQRHRGQLLLTWHETP